MNLYKLYSQGVYQTTRGELKWVKPLSITSRTLFFNKLLPLLRENLIEIESTRVENGLDPKTFKFYYDNYPIISQLTKACLDIFSISVEEITIDQVSEFLIEYKGESGWLIQISQPIEIENTEVLQQVLDTRDPNEKVAAIIAALSMITNDIMSAVTIVDELPSDLVDQVLESRRSIYDDHEKSIPRGKIPMSDKVEQELMNDYMRHIANN